MTLLGAKLRMLFYGPSQKNVLKNLTREEMTLLTTAISLAGDEGIPNAEKLLMKVMRKGKLTTAEAVEVCKMTKAFLPAAVQYVKERQMIGTRMDAAGIGESAIDAIASFYGLKP